LGLNLVKVSGRSTIAKEMENSVRDTVHWVGKTSPNHAESSIKRV
jgi:hypothetical protein